VLPVDEPSDSIAFVYEDVVRLDVGMAKSRKVELWTLWDKMWSYTQILLK
jgi:hypothetical protein